MCMMTFVPFFHRKTETFKETIVYTTNVYHAKAAYVKAFLLLLLRSSRTVWNRNQVKISKFCQDSESVRFLPCESCLRESFFIAFVAY